ncbi:unnamed protein product [Leuciscus chuanchicus]
MVLSAHLCQQAKRPGGDAGVQGSFVLAGALGREIQIAIAVSLFHKDVEGHAGRASLAAFLYGSKAQLPHGLLELCRRADLISPLYPPSQSPHSSAPTSSLIPANSLIHFLLQLMSAGDRLSQAFSKDSCGITENIPPSQHYPMGCFLMRWRRATDSDPPSRAGTSTGDPERSFTAAGPEPERTPGARSVCDSAKALWLRPCSCSRCERASHSAQRLCLPLDSLCGISLPNLGGKKSMGERENRPVRWQMFGSAPH